MFSLWSPRQYPSWYLTLIAQNKNIKKKEDGRNDRKRPKKTVKDAAKMAEKCPKKEVLKLLPQKGSYRFTRVLRYERPRQKRATRLKWPKYGLNGLPRENGRKWITARFSSFPYYLRSIFGFRTLVDGVAGVTLGRAWLRSFPYYSCFRELSSEVQVKYVSFLSLHVA